jgi:pimeloyl-ACP methyl ester carboxylesterase
MKHITVSNGAIELNVAVAGEGPLIVCVHGWPELWCSWRHQLERLPRLGYRVAALDVRGYGGSSKPPDVADYVLRKLARDVIAVIDALGEERAILFGHDWGAPISWITAQLHPDRVSAVALLSVPFIPLGDRGFLDLMRSIYAGRFFYQLYFQPEGVAEAEIEADLRTALRRIYFTWSGDAPPNHWLGAKPADATLLEGLEDPEPFPSWMSDADFDVYLNAFSVGGFRGPLNRYRAHDLDHADLVELQGQPLAQPSCFVAGERDSMRALIPGMDLYQNPGLACADFRGSVIVPGAGHWVQQEAPDATHHALEGFLRTLA